MEQSNQFLGTERIGKLMTQYAVPCIISLLVGALYNIVDQLFIANASYLGSYGNAANTVVFPLTVVALAIAVMIGDGCCAFVSICLGKGDTASAKKSVGNAVIFSVVSSLILTVIYLVFQDQIIAMFGGTVNEPSHPGRRKSQICNGGHSGRRHRQHHFGPDLYFPFQMGHDGCSRCHRNRSDSDSPSLRLVYSAHENHQTVQKRLFVFICA